MNSTLKIAALIISPVVFSFISTGQTRSPINKPQEGVKIKSMPVKQINVVSIDSISPKMELGLDETRSVTAVPCSQGCPYVGIYPLDYTTYQQTYGGNDVRNSPVWYNLVR